MGRHEFHPDCPCCPTTVECLGCLVPLMLEVNIVASTNDPYYHNKDCTGLLGGSGLLLYQLQPPFYDSYGWSGEVETDCGTFHFFMGCSPFTGGYLAGMVIYDENGSVAPCGNVRGGTNSNLVSTHIECTEGPPLGPQGPNGPGNLVLIEFEASLSETWSFGPNGDCECCGGAGNFFALIRITPA